jgi:hypothetical protein
MSSSPGRSSSRATCKLHAAHAGQVTLARRRVAGGEQRTVHGHRLGGIFDAGGSTEAVVGAQWIGRVNVAAGPAGDCLRRPVDDGVEQAHAALVRNVIGDPGVV